MTWDELTALFVAEQGTHALETTLTGSGLTDGVTPPAEIVTRFAAEFGEHALHYSGFGVALQAFAAAL